MALPKIAVMTASSGPPSRSHTSSWKQRPSWPKLRIEAGQEVELLIVGDPWTFDVPSPRKKCAPSTHHVVNIVLRQHLLDGAVKACMVWEISDRLYNQIVFDPTINWFLVKRYGAGKQDTYYEIVAISAASRTEVQLAADKHQYDLEMVAAETCARRQRNSRRTSSR